MKTLLALIIILALGSCSIQTRIAQQRYRPVYDNNCVMVWDSLGRRTMCVCPTLKDASLISEALNHYIVNTLYDNNTITVFK